MTTTVRTYGPRGAVHPLLGRIQVLDDRSLPYTIERRLDTAPKIQPVDHPISIGILDQSDLHAQGIVAGDIVPGGGDPDALGSCTGNAGTYAASTSPEITRRVAEYSAPLDERYAIGLYADATRADEILAQEWPPTDCGSSGLGVCKVMRSRGLIDSYEHATTAAGFAALLQDGAVLMGTPWFESWFSPDADGFVDHGDPGSWGEIAGGHELCVVALESWDADDPGKSVVRFVNSWTETWGVDGYGRMRLSTYQQMRRDIDVKAFRVHPKG